MYHIYIYILWINAYACSYKYIYIYIHTHICIYIYIYRERERALMNSAAADRSPGGPAAGRSRIRRAPCQEGGKVPLVEIPWARIAR